MTTVPLRTSGVVKYRRFVVQSIITALRSVFDQNYARERQLQDLHIVDKYPLQKTEYPAIVVEFVDRRVSNAGVGHEEWFNDINGIFRKWQHSRFEGSINLDIYARTPLDRDLLADALIETLRFGTLDNQLLKFFVGVYPGSYFGTEGVQFLLNQLMLNTDEIDGRGNSATLAPWAPEDQLVYRTGYSLECHGGFYNSPLTNVYTFVESINVDAYMQGDVQILLDVPGFPLSNPGNYLDSAVVQSVGHPTATESFV